MNAAEILARLEWDEDGLPSGWPADQGVLTAGPEVLAWSETLLVQPDGDGAGTPWRWRRSQARFVSWWYAIDEAGSYLWRRGQIVLPKGAGKSPMAAALGCIELAGPVRFVGWDDDGQPIMASHPSPDVKLSALSQDQAADATMALSVAMLDNLDAYAEIPGLSPGITQVRTRNGKLTSATARAPSKEGLRPTAVVLDEAHLWVQENGGKRLAETLRRGVAKTGGRSLETTNQWATGQRSVAEETAEYAESVRAGIHLGDGVLTWRPVGHCDDLSDPEQLRAGLAELYYDSPWIDIERLAAEVVDRGTHPADARRYYLNQSASADDAWILAKDWAACLDRGRPLADGETITLGFDGSRGRARGNADATALVAVRVLDGHVQLIDCWQAGEDEKDWEVPDALVDAAVHDAFERFKVVGFYADPSGWQSQLGAWEKAYSRQLKVSAGPRHPTHFWSSQASRMVRALAAFEEAVTNGDLTHDGSYRLTQHVLNARRNPTPRAGLQIAKEYPDSPNKIDCAVAATLAWSARLDAQTKGVKSSGRGPRHSDVVTVNLELVELAADAEFDANAEFHGGRWWHPMQPRKGSIRLEARRSGVEVAHVELVGSVNVGHHAGASDVDETGLEIAFIEVAESQRRQGLATHVVRALADRYPDRRLFALSQDADAFWSSLGWDRVEGAARYRPLYVQPTATA